MASSPMLPKRYNPPDRSIHSAALFLFARYSLICRDRRSSNHSTQLRRRGGSHYDFPDTRSFFQHALALRPLGIERTQHRSQNHAPVVRDHHVPGNYQERAIRQYVKHDRADQPWHATTTVSSDHFRGPRRARSRPARSNPPRTSPRDPVRRRSRPRSVAQTARLQKTTEACERVGLTVAVVTEPLPPTRRERRE